MKKSTKLWIVASVAAAAAAIFTVGIVHELMVIKKLTTDIDDLPEEELPEEIAE